MKKTIFPALFALLFSLNGQGQSCLPNGITFKTQEEINSFHANYPGCTVIEGDMTIGFSSTGNITNLDSLNGLTSIGRDLYIRNGNALSSLNGLNTLTSIGRHLIIKDNVSLPNLNGLNNLTTVGSNVSIGGSTWLTNAALTSLSGLENLTSVGGSLTITNSPVLQNLNALGNLMTLGESLTVGSNPLLQSLNGLANLDTLGALNIFSNHKLTSLTGLTSLQSVKQEIKIINNPLLTDLGFLENFTVCNGSLEISDNTALTTLSALQNLTTLNNGFKISGSPAITSLVELANISTVVGNLTIENMDGLSDLHSLENIQITGDYPSIIIAENDLLSNLNGLGSKNIFFHYLDIRNNALLTDLQGLENLTTIGSNQDGGIFISRNSLLTSLNGLNNLVSVTGYLSLSENSSLQNLNGLNNLVSVMGTLSLYKNSSLKNLSGLDKLATIGTLHLEQNDNLLNLSGLDNIISIDGLSVRGYSNSAFKLSGLTSGIKLGGLKLYYTSLKNLAGLESISMTGSVHLESNAALENLNGLQGSTTLGGLNLTWNPALTSLTGLENVTKIYGGLRIGNNKLLTDLNELSNLKTLRGSLFIYRNQLLSDCAANGFCLFISDPPHPDSINIEYNAPGCNSPAEVSAPCTNSAITVKVWIDNNATCSSGLPVADVPVRFTGGDQTTLKPTNLDGLAKFRYFDTAPFQIVLPQLSDEHWNVCEVRQNFVASNGGDSTYVSFFLSPKVNCPKLNIKFNLLSNFRECLVHSDLRVSVQNIGTVLAEAGKVAVVMPPVFDLLSTEPLLSGQNGDTLYFEVGDLKPFESTFVKLTVKTKCDTFLIGQALCWEAFAAMDNPCPLTGQAYSEIKLSAKCIGDTIVRLGLTNIGNAPTQGWHDYIIIRNEYKALSNAFNLDAQESLSFDFPADGATWRMEATKFSDGTQTAVALENCGGLTPGLITAFWLDHGPVEYDFDCRQVSQFYEPNRKTAVPTGIGYEHVIATAQPIYYTINFQNTGTDTVFRVKMIDILSDNLDVSTFKLEGASHLCSWDIRNRSLEVNFWPITLPNSSVNEAASQGYFSFSIYPKSSLTDGTGIYNSAQLSFDLNWPIGTNGVYHSVRKLTVSADEPQTHAKLWQVLGNPTRDVAIFRAETFVAGEKRFELFDASGRLLRSAQFSGQEFEFKRDLLPGGLYFFRISDGQHRMFTGKIVVAE